MSNLLTGEEVPASRLHFSRFEFKYLLNANRRVALESDLQHFLQYDPFVALRENHQYPVRSLYFDDPRYSAFHDKIDGLLSRSKFRVRTYSGSIDDDAPVFLEIKGRTNNLVFKHRIATDGSSADWSGLKGEAVIQSIIDRAGKGAVRDQFCSELYRKRLRPVALIDYQRRPYLSKYDPLFRLTFDECLTATHTTSLFPTRVATPKQVVAGFTILEVKFRHHLPSWFHRVIQTHELRRISISKIVSGMETLGLAYDEH